MIRSTPAYRREMLLAVEQDGRLARLSGVPLATIRHGMPHLCKDVGLGFCVARQAVMRGWSLRKGGAR